MDPSLRAVLGVCMRWIHISSVVTLIGGFIFARFAMTPALESVSEPTRGQVGDKAVASFRGILYTVLVTALGSGMYNYLSKASYPPHYHMIIGIKFLFVMHIFAVTVLYTIPGAGEAKRKRWLTGLVGSGLIVIAISAYLRWLSLQ